MKQTFKRFLSAALALAMVFTMLPHMVHAEPESTDLLNLNFEDGNVGDLSVTSNVATEEGYSADVQTVSGNKVLAVHADPGIKLNLTYALPEAMSSATLTYYIASVGQGSADFPCFYTSSNINASMPKFGLLNGAGIRGYITTTNQIVAGANGETISHSNYQWHAVKVVFNAGVTKLYIDGILTNVNNQHSTNTTANRIGMVVSSHDTQISDYYIDNIRVTAGAGEENTGSHEPAAVPNPIDLVNLDFTGVEEGTVPSGITVSTTGGAVGVKTYANNQVLSVGTNAAGKTTTVYYTLPASQTQVTLTYHINQVSEGTAYFPTFGYTSPNYNVQFGVHDTSMAYKTAWTGSWNTLSPQDSGTITHSCNQWHAVKVVIDTVAKTTKVFIDGVLTNVEYSTAVDTRAVTNVNMYVFEDIGEFYIDNLRVTQGVGADGNGSHEPAATPDKEVLDWTFDFEDATVGERPDDIQTNLDATNTSYSLKVVEVAGNKVLSVGTDVNAASTVYLQWWYELPFVQDEVTLTYNIVQRISHSSNFLTVGNSNGFANPTVRFGTANQLLIYNDGSQKTLAAANADESISHALNKWHTVKVVYSKSGVCKVFIDDILTNVATNKAETISRIGMYLNGKNGDAFYIDNIRVTEGIGDDSNGSHEPTVPTACLCQTPIWANGICSVCNAHCDHDWADADCDTPKTCNVCGNIEGEPLGHSWEDGVCTRCDTPCTHVWEDSICTVCGYGCLHENYTPADCDSPWICLTCCKTEGDVSHNWTPADCDTPKTCSDCGTTEGDALGHDYDENGACQNGCGTVCPHEGFTDDVCDVCGYVCLHETWTPANCSNPKTCTVCKKTEGEKGGDHVLGDDNVCDVCGFAYLADFDFEDGILPGVASTHDGGSSDVQVAEVNGNKVLKLYRANGEGPVYWYYDLGGTYQNVTLTYNVAFTTATPRSILFPTVNDEFSTDVADYALLFGHYSSNNLQYYTGGWTNITTSGAASIPATRNQWFTVKIVYSKDGDNTNDIVYIDGLPTNVAVKSYVDISKISILLGTYFNQYPNTIYVDNIRATTGDPAYHLPAVPTAPLCSLSGGTCVVGDDGMCSVCHAVLGNYTHTVESVNVALGDTLDMNFFIDPTTDMGMGNGTYYAKIVQTLADGSELTKIVPQAEWKWHEGYEQFYVTYGVAAKEMGDTLTVTIRDSEGNVVSAVYTDTLKDYIGRLRENNASDEYLVKLCDDLLIYGAAAQKGFGYNTENLVSEVRPSKPTATDNSNGDKPHWNGTSLGLESNILMKVFFLAESMTDAEKYRVTYTDHYNLNATEVIGTDFGCNGGKDTDLYVPVTGLSIADYKTLVTVEILNDKDEVLYTVVDSIESFVARSGLTYDIYRAIIQVGTSAFNYFHKDSQTT